MVIGILVLRKVRRTCFGLSVASLSEKLIIRYADYILHTDTQSMPLENIIHLIGCTGLHFAAVKEKPIRLHARLNSEIMKYFDAPGFMKLSIRILRNLDLYKSENTTLSVNTKTLKDLYPEITIFAHVALHFSVL